MRILCLLLFMVSLLVCSGGCGGPEDVIPEKKAAPSGRSFKADGNRMDTAPDKNLETKEFDT